jgi:cell division topological specificity factor
MDRITGRESASANQAKERLQLVLIHDRTDITPGELDSMKNELLDVILRHIDIDPSAVRIMIAQDGREQKLVADIPLKSATRHRKG